MRRMPVVFESYSSCRFFFNCDSSLNNFHSIKKYISRQHILNCYCLNLKYLFVKVKSKSAKAFHYRLVFKGDLRQSLSQFAVGNVAPANSNRDKPLRYSLVINISHNPFYLGNSFTLFEQIYLFL